MKSTNCHQSACCGRSHRRRGPRRPRSAWLFVQRPKHLGARFIEPWLLATIVQFIATQNRPGHRVLLLARPFDSGASRLLPSGPRAVGGPLAALIEAAGSASRLGRGLAVVAGVPAMAARAPEGAPCSGSQSLHRLVAESLPPAPSYPGLSRSRPGLPAGDPHRYDAVITPADPVCSDWTTGLHGDRLLTPSETLAFVTQSDRVTGRLIESVGPVAHAALSAWLLLLDYVVALRLPVERCMAPPADLRGEQFVVGPSRGFRRQGLSLVRVSDDTAAACTEHHDAPVFRVPRAAGAAPAARRPRQLPPRDWLLGFGLRSPLGNGGMKRLLARALKRTSGLCSASNSHVTCASRHLPLPARQPALGGDR